MNNLMCQCPRSGYSYFYVAKEEVVRRFLGGVNALGRATPISTTKCLLLRFLE